MATLNIVSRVANTISCRLWRPRTDAPPGGRALAAKSATSTIPIVFAVASDPVKLGLVASYNRPGGNATGMNVLTATLEAKRLGLIHELVPQAATIGFLTNPRFASAEGQVHDVQEAARALALKVRVLPASTEKDIVAAFGTISGESILALAVGSHPFFDTQREEIIALAARYSVPTIYQFREHAAAGGLTSYGIDIGRISPDWRSSRLDSQRRESGGPAGPAANQVRVCHQSQDC
jgi:putative ABC transport system substrate-binding protein